MRNFHLIITLVTLFIGINVYSQWSDCSNNIPACSNPSFNVTPNGSGNDIDFTTGSTVSNPQFNPNPNPGNSGCLQAGELNSTWITISVSQGGLLEFSMGTANSFNCFDWIMWPLTPNTCSGIQNNTLPPIACNWNGACNGITGMTAPGNLPPGGDQSDFEYALNVNTGDQFILCFSNYSSASTNVPLNFFGSAQVTCGSVTNPTICYGETAEIIVFDGVSYTWNTSAPGFVSASGNSAFVNPTVTSNYTVTITYSDGSTTSATSTVTVLPQLTTNISSTPETCAGTNDGSISVSASNGSAPYSYHLTGGTTSTNSTGNFTGLGAGNYTIDITDANGCTAQTTATLSTGPACCSMILTTTTTSIDCFGNCNGTVSVDTSGTTGSATIQWYNNGSAITGGNGLSLSNLCGGSYSVEVSDQVCTITANATVTEPSNLTISSNGSDLDCNGDNSGQIILNASGGTSPYSYSINAGGTFQASSTFSNLGANTYSIVVKDANGCLKTAVVPISEPTLLTASTSVTNNTCNQLNASCNGGVTSSVQGGSPPYSYSWSSGPTTSNLVNVCAGNYTLTVTDENGCAITLPSSIVTQPLAVSINSIIRNHPLCHDDCNGTLTIQATNATNYSIDGGTTFSSQNNFTDLCSGNYSIVVTDINGCSSSTTSSLLNPDRVEADFTFSPDSAVVSNPYFELTSISTVGSDYYWYYIDGSDTILNYEPTPTLHLPEDGPGIYETCIVAYNTNFCFDTTCYNLVVGDEFFLFVPNSFSPNDDGINDIFYPYVNNYDQNVFEFFIFDRWGEMIFKSESPLNGWNGIHVSTPCPEGTYIWKIKTQSEFDKVKQVYMGHVNLFR
ncbi:MAG: gliding motility-associated C-terminal domain-containing protein [Flavobacteriales bacterium]|nr:gliding motility-associated C-terminal domain-containing protein [Flavobacteriales bacterium]